MSPAIFCRLCGAYCTKYKSLIDEDGQSSAAYEIAVKYFDPMLLNPEIENTATAICIHCWTCIRDFNQFQQNVMGQTKIQKLQKQFETHQQENENSTNITDYTIVEINSEINRKIKDQLSDEEAQPETGPCPDCYNESICSECYATFSCPYLLREHFQIEHPNNNFTDSICCPYKEQTIRIDDAVASFKTILECEKCEHTFAYYSLLEQHFKLDHSEEKCYVICCKQKYRNINDLLKHIDLHLNPNTQQCHICSLILSVKSSLKRHLENVHGEQFGLKQFLNLSNPNPCVHDDNDDDDANDDNTLTVLNEKRKESHRIEPTTKIDKELLINGTLTNELECYSQTNEIPSFKRRVQEYDAFIARFLVNLICAECKESFNNFALLSQHYREKHPDKNKCNTICCNRKLNNRFAIVSHIRRIHLTTGDKRKVEQRNPNKCHLCRMIFTNNHSLRRHMSKTHPTSSIAKKQKFQKLSREQKNPIRKSYKNNIICHACKLVFTTKESLARHNIRKHQGNTNQNTEVGIGTSTEVTVNRKQYTSAKKYSCKICKITYTRNHSLKKHIFRIHNNDYEAFAEIDTAIDELKYLNTNECEGITQAETSTEVTVNTSANKYACKVCKIAYTRNHNLKKHIFSKHNNDYEAFAHIETATEDKDKPVGKYACHICKKRYTRKHNVDKHISRKHSRKTAKRVQKPKFEKQNNNDEIREHKNLDLTHDREAQFEEVQIEDACYDEEYENNSEIEFPISSSLIVPNQFQNSPIDIVDLKPNLSLNSDNESSAGSDNDTISLNGKLGNESDTCFKPSTRNVKEKSLEYDDFIAKWKGDLECPLCNNMFANYGMLKDHFRNEHPTIKSYIICCQRKLNNRFHVAEHLKLHINPKAFQCDVCGRCCFSGYCLGRHKRLVHGGKDRIQLRVCSCEVKKSTSANAGRNEICCKRKQNVLEADAIIAKWKNRLGCSLCSQTFPYYSLLRDHFYIEHRRDRCVIQCCQRKMLTTHEVVTHIRNMHLQQSYKCDICETEFPTSRSFSKHMNNFHNYNAGFM